MLEIPKLMLATISSATSPQFLGNWGEIKKIKNNVYFVNIVFTLFCILSLLNFRKSIFQKLYDLYIEECEKEPEVKVCIVFLCCMAFEM